MAQPARYGWHQRLAERFGVWGDALYLLVAGAGAIAISGLAAHLLRQTLLFPSLGPTVFLVFETPLAAQSSPRNTLIGHGVGIAVGFGAIVLFGLRGPRACWKGARRRRASGRRRSPWRSPAPCCSYSTLPIRPQAPQR
jgi:hypothetical protein